MRVERTTLVLAVLLLLAVAIVNVKTAIADPVNPTGVDNISTSRGNLNPASQQVNVQAGNVSEIGLNTTSITDSWAGFYGNITGTIVLQDGSGNNFYDWNMSSPSGEVFASRAASPTWANIACADAANITAEETTLSQSATDGDSVSNTFSGTTHPSFQVGDTTLSGCPATNAYDNNGAQTTRFFNVLLADDSSNVVYSTLLNASSTGFDGGTYDFQLLVGENGSNGNSATTTYYFFVEIN